MSPREIHGNEANQRVSSSGRRVQIAAAVIVAADLSIVAWGLLAVFSLRCWFLDSCSTPVRAGWN